MSFIFDVPVKVKFGANSLKSLKDEDLPFKKAFIVLSNGTSYIKNGSLETLTSILKEKNIEYVLFNKIEANPTTTIVDEAIDICRKTNCDFLIGLGGGSVLDSTTIIAATVPNTGYSWDYIETGSGGKKKLINKSLPYIEITTSAGTGSEVDAWGVLSKIDTHEKTGFHGEYAFLAIVDPTLMLTVPPTFTAYQGFDALFHSLEGYVSKFVNEGSELVEEKAISNIAKYLPIAVKDGNNLEARTALALANTLSGYSMCIGTCTSEHSIEHSLSGFAHSLPHGAGLIMISYSYFKHWIDRHVCDDRFIKIAKLMGNKDATAATDFLIELKNLQKACNVDNLKMSDYGINKDMLHDIAINARYTMPGLFSCDRFDLTDEIVEEILIESYK